MSKDTPEDTPEDTRKVCRGAPELLAELRKERPRRTAAEQFQAAYDDVCGPGAFLRDFVIGDAKRVSTTDRAEENRQFQFAVQALFAMDADKILTTSTVRRLPWVLDWQEARDIEDETVRRLVVAVSPDYAKPKPGRRKGSGAEDWETPPKICLVDLNKIYIRPRR